MTVVPSSVAIVRWASGAASDNEGPSIFRMVPTAVAVFRCRRPANGLLIHLLVASLQIKRLQWLAVSECCILRNEMSIRA